jgi:hypothetical protein
MRSKRCLPVFDAVKVSPKIFALAALLCRPAPSGAGSSHVRPGRDSAALAEENALTSLTSPWLNHYRARRLPVPRRPSLPRIPWTMPRTLESSAPPGLGLTL